MNLFPSTRIIYSPINTRETRADGSANPLADKRVRQALNYATNKEALIGLVLQGAGKPHDVAPDGGSHPACRRNGPALWL